MLASLGLALLVAASTILISYAIYRRERESFVIATAGSIETSLSLVDDALYTAGTYLSHLTPLVEIYSGRDDGITAVEAVYDVTMATVNYNTMIADIVVVDMEGKARSFSNGVGVELVDLVSAQYDYADTGLIAPRYFFFPEHTFTHGEEFAYMVPLLDVDTTSGEVSKRGSIIVACYTEGFESLLAQALNAEYACKLTASDGGVIASHTPDNFQVGGIEYNMRLKYPYRSIELRTPRVWPLGGGTMRHTLWGMCAAIIAVTLFAVFVIRKSILKPVYALSEKIVRIGAAGGVGRLSYEGVSEIDLIAQNINEMLDRMKELTNAELDARTRLIEAQLRKNEAELYALQSQINPHFLFNSLQCIRAMAILAHADEVASMTSSLSSLMRYAISGTGMVRVGEEVGAVKEYLNIVDIRYAHRFRLDLCVPPDMMAILIPKMILQPLVENAVSHGVSMREEGGRVFIAAHTEKGRAVFTITDDGPGIPAQRLSAMREVLEMDFHDAVSAKKLTSFGLYNIQRRIRLQFGEEYGLTLESQIGKTRAIIEIPAWGNEEAADRAPRVEKP